MAQELTMIVRWRDLRNFTGLGPTQIEDLMREGNFPRPIKLTDAGRAKGWFVSELQSWQAYRKAKTANETSCATWLDWDLSQRTAQ